MLEFYGVRLEKLPAGRNIEKQMVDGYGGAHRARAWGAAFVLASRAAQLNSYFMVSRSRAQGNLANGSHRCEGFSAKSHRSQGKQVVGVAQL